MTIINGKFKKHGYKVCRKVGGKLYSAEVFHPSAEIEYVPLKAVIPKPNCGPLCFFSVKRNAQMYLHHIRTQYPDWSFTLCKCLYIKASPAKLKGVWYYANKDLVFKLYSDLPNGSLLALSLTIIPIKRPSRSDYDKRIKKERSLEFSRWLYLTYCEQRNLAKQAGKKYFMAHFLSYLRQQGIYRSRQAVSFHFKRYQQTKGKVDG